jgi:hypothetical protein
MTEIRARLEDALQEHLYEWRENGWHCAKCDVPARDTDDDWSSQHVIEVLLSLPGIAIMDTEVDYQLGDRWKTLCSNSPEHARSFAAALLAAANAAEATQ